jgi:hypothetical protein
VAVSSLTPAPRVLAPRGDRLSVVRPGRRVNPERLQLVVLGALVVAAALLRLRYLNEPMRYDESATFHDYVRESVGTITSSYDHPNNQIFYTLLTHFSVKAFGEGIAAVRLIAFAAGTALVPAAFLAGKRLYDAQAGLWAAGLAATSAPLIDYSVNARGYTLGALLVVLAVWAGAILLEKSSVRAWIGFVLCGALAVYTVPTMAIGIAAAAAWIAANAILDRNWRLVFRLVFALVVTGLLALLLYSAVLGRTGWHTVAPVAVAWGPIKALAGSVLDNWNRAAPHPLDWLIAGGFVASLVAHRRIAKQPIPLAAATAAVLLVVILLAPIPPFVRSWLFLLPLYLIHAGAGLAWLTRRLGRWAPLAPALAGGLLAVTMLHTGLKGSDVPPSSDNDIMGLLHRYAPQPTTVLFERSVRAPVHYYYYERFGDDTFETPLVRPRDRAQGHLVVVVPRGTSPSETVHKAGGTAAARGTRLLTRREWIEFYDVPILR